MIIRTVTLEFERVGEGVARRYRMFNYRSEMNGLWGEQVLCDRYEYRTEYPDNSIAAGKRVSL